MNSTLGSSQGSFRITVIHSSQLLLKLHSGIHELSNDALIINCPGPCMFYKCLIRYAQQTPKGETPERNKEQNIANNYTSVSSHTQRGSSWYFPSRKEYNEQKVKQGWRDYDALCCLCVSSPGLSHS